MKLKMKSSILAPVLCGLIATTAFAAVTFDATTGIGFVGKGDVQSSLGWNDAKLQANAGDITFSYSTSDTYEAVCTWTTGEGKKGEKTHDVTHTKKTAVNSSISHEARLNKNNTGNKINGFNLSGLGTTTSTGTVPEVDGACMGNEGHDGTWSSVTPTGSTGGGLSFSYGGTSYPLQ